MKPVYYFLAAVYPIVQTFAVDQFVSTSQELQTALTLSASNGVDDTIFLAAGYYQGNFNYQSTEDFAITIQADNGVSRDQITLDPSGNGRALSIAGTGNMPITLSGFTVLQNYGGSNSGVVDLTTFGDISVTDLDFFGNGNMLGGGLFIDDANTASFSNCNFALTEEAVGHGLWIQSTIGDVTIEGCSFSGYDDGSDHRRTATALRAVTTNSDTNEYPLLTIRGSSFQNNSDQALQCFYYDLLVTDCVFTGNSGGSGAAVLQWGDADANVIRIQASTFTANSGSSGGACYFQDGAVTVENCRFDDNLGNGNGGALFMGDGNNDPVIRRSSFSNNRTRNRGGAIYHYSDTGITIEDSSFDANHTSETSNNASYGGGAVFIYSSTSITNCTIRGNAFTANYASTGKGGAIYFYDGSGSTSNGGVLADNRFIKNRTLAAGGDGGALYIEDSEGFVIVNNVFADNQAENRGGGLYIGIDGPSLTFTNNTVSRNESKFGGGFYFSVFGQDEVVDVYNNIVWGNTASEDGGDIYLTGIGSTKSLVNNTFTDIFGVWDIALNNVDVAPIFFDPDNGDYHLRPNSPTINIGANTAPGITATDQDGIVRIAGSTVDLGAYEFDAEATHPADVNLDFIINEAEFNAYSAAWKSSSGWDTGPDPIPADYVTRAGFILTQGGGYFVGGGGLPVGWEPATNP